MPLHTRFTDRFSLDLPIVGAPMALASGGALAAAVSHAGGLGLIGGGYCDSDWIGAQFLAAGNAAVGCGVITWKLAQSPEVLDAILAHKPRALLFSFGDFAPFAAQVRDAGVPIFAQVQTLAMARAAVKAGADVIIAQGSEAGGHGASRATMTLVPEVVDAIGDRALVLAAGGIADGRGLAAALALGADGAVIGSRLWASDEALVHDGFHRAALYASGDETTRSSLPDIARGLDWPAPFTIRTLRNAWIDGHRQAGTSPSTPEAQSAYADAFATGDAAIAPAIVGEGVGLIRSLQPAGEIVTQIGADAEAILNNLGRGGTA